MTDCKCQHPCSPCNNNCPDDGEILNVEILDPEDCSTNCCGKSCKDNCGINIQSTNDCLTVDTSECGVVKLTAECPKPTYVKAGDNVTIKEVTPPDDCYIDGGDCGIKGGWEVSATDEKVKACSGDTTPGYLNKKLKEGPGIIIDEINCGGEGDAYLKVSIDENYIPEIPDIPDVEVRYGGSLLTISQEGDHKHIINIADNTTSNFYDNVVMLGFFHNKDKTVILDSQANSERPYWISTSEDGVGRDMCTGNKKLATNDGILIKQSGHYYVYGQITVMNNIGVLDRYLNLGRGLIKLTRNGNDYLINTAKHGAYGTFVTLKGGKGINVAQNGTISINRGTVNVGEGGGTYEVNFQNGSGVQPTSGFDGPWMTLNIGVYLDLYEGDKLTLGYRPQSNELPEAPSQSSKIRFVGHDDASTSYQALFGGTTLGLHPITPTLFQKGALRDLIS